MDFLRFAELDAIVVRTKGFLPTAENCNRVYYTVLDMKQRLPANRSTLFPRMKLFNNSTLVSENLLSRHGKCCSHFNQCKS